MKTVCVLLSTYNGEKYINDLIDSVLAQEGVSVELVVRDDGSTDNTISLLREYERAGELVLLECGENLGYAKSFWRLLTIAAGADYYAFADQDDIWLSDKLSRAVRMLEKYSEPCLYTSDVVPVDNNLTTVMRDIFPVHGPLNLEESLQHSILPGCTFVFNEAAKIVAARFDGYMESHDWALYAIVTLFGTVLFDDEPSVLYRLHADNTIGAQTTIAAFKAKIKRFFSPSNRTRSRFAKALLYCYGNDMSMDLKRRIFILADCNRNFTTKVNLAFSTQFKGIIFRAYALLGRI